MRSLGSLGFMSASSLLVRGEMEPGLGQALLLVTLFSIPLAHEGSLRSLRVLGTIFQSGGNQEVTLPEAAEHRGRMATTTHMLLFLKGGAVPHGWDRVGWRAPQGG